MARKDSPREIVYGQHSPRAVLLTRPDAVRRIVILDGRKSQTKKSQRWTDYYLDLTRPAGVRPEVVPWRDFHRLNGLDEQERHQGICLWVEPRPILPEAQLELLADGRRSSSTRSPIRRTLARSCAPRVFSASTRC